MNYAVKLVLGSGGLAALVFLMSFSYGPNSSPPTLNPAIDYPRLLISDTQQFDPKGNQIYIFQDQEILAMYNIVQANFQSSMFYSPPAGRNLPASPVSYLRVAAYLLNAVAANKARLASIKKLLDVQLDSSDAAIQLRETAQQYLDMDDNAGAFAIIEMCNDYFSFRDRFWKQVQRQSGA
jgi:hypothetical protein